MLIDTHCHLDAAEFVADRDALVHDLETKRVLMYRNGEDWYDVHPLLRDQVDPPPAGAPAAVHAGLAWTSRRR